MRVRQFGVPFPDLAARQMVMLWIDPPRKQLPVKAYGLLEYYCDEPGCDCRRVVLDAVSSDHPGRVFASIHFGWERLEFYRKWSATRDLGDARMLKKGVLDPAALNCDWADVLLAHVRKEVLAKPLHHELFQDAAKGFKKRFCHTRQNQVSFLRLRPLTTFLPPFERHCNFSNVRLGRKNQNCGPQFNICIISLRRLGLEPSGHTSRKARASVGATSGIVRRGISINVRPTSPKSCWRGIPKSFCRARFWNQG